MSIRCLAVIKVLSLFKRKLFRSVEEFPTPSADETSLMMWWKQQISFYSIFSSGTIIISHTVNFLSSSSSLHVPAWFICTEENATDWENAICQIVSSGSANQTVTRVGQLPAMPLPPTLYVLHIKAKRFAQVLQEKWFGYQIDLLDRIECSNWMRGRENKFLALFPVSPRLLTLDRFLSRVNRSSSDCDSCHYIRIFSDRMKL